MTTGQLSPEAALWCKYRGYLHHRAAGKKMKMEKISAYLSSGSQCCAGWRGVGPAAHCVPHPPTHPHSASRATAHAPCGCAQALRHCIGLVNCLLYLAHPVVYFLIARSQCTRPIMPCWLQVRCMPLRTSVMWEPHGRWPMHAIGPLDRACMDRAGQTGGGKGQLCGCAPATPPPFASAPNQPRKRL